MRSAVEEARDELQRQRLVRRGARGLRGCDHGPRRGAPSSARRGARTHDAGGRPLLWPLEEVRLPF